MRVHFGKQVMVLYDWEGRPRIYAVRAASALTRAVQLESDPRASNVRVKIGDREYVPANVTVYR